MSLPFWASDVRFFEKRKAIHQKIQEKKYNFLKEEAKVIENNQRMRVLKQIFSQNPMFYILNSSLFVITKGWKSTRAQILNNS